MLELKTMNKQAKFAAKDFISSMDSGKDVYTCIDAGRAKFFNSAWMLETKL